MRCAESFRGKLLPWLALGAFCASPSQASLVVVPDTVRAPRAEAVATRGADPRTVGSRSVRPPAPSASEQRRTEQRCLEELMLYSLGDPHGTGASNRRLRCD